MYKIEKSLSLKADLNKLFSFYLDPKNLKLLSSPSMDFKAIIQKVPIEKDSCFQIKLNLFPFIRVNWDLTVVELIENKIIVDFQRSGSFKFWRHKKKFEELFDGTVILTDEIEYETKLGFLGILLNPIIKWRINNILNLRYKIIQSLFGG